MHVVFVTHKVKIPSFQEFHIRICGVEINRKTSKKEKKMLNIRCQTKVLNKVGVIISDMMVSIFN